MSLSVGNQTAKVEAIVQTCLSCLPEIQAIYLFGSWATAQQNEQSDLDLALLLPQQQAKALANLYGSKLHKALESLLKIDIDLINIREANTVLQKEVIADARRVYCADAYAADEFEMLTMSYYQKLNDERAAVLQSFYKTKRAYNV
jgi:predicted nucleotidyltransferase